MLNRPLIRTIIRHLKKKEPLIDAVGAELGFNMAPVFAAIPEYYDDKLGHDCNSVGCICGWTLLLSGQCQTVREATEWYAKNGLDKTFRTAGELLGLSDAQAYNLFQGEFVDTHRDNITPTQVITELKRILHEDLG